MTPRMAVVGAGSWSTEMHLPAARRVQAEGLADYVGVADLNPEAARPYAARLDAAAFTDADEMLRKTEPDGVLLLVRQHDMPGLIATMAELGLPFLCEKPPAPDTQTHRRLIEVGGDLPHVVAYNRRHAPYVQQAKAWLEGVRPHLVLCEMVRYRRREEDFSGTAVHGIDTALYLAGEPLAEARIEVAPVEAVNNFFIDGWTTGGTRVSVLVTPDTGSRQEHYTVRSIDRNVLVAFPMRHMIDCPGYAELHDDREVAARITNEDLGVEPDDHPALLGVRAEHERFARIVAGEASSVATLANTLQTQQLRERLYQPGISERTRFGWSGTSE